MKMGVPIDPFDGWPEQMPATTPQAVAPLVSTRTPAQQSTITSLSDYRKVVFDEFKLVEEKIDRIGEFLFKIRAWAITASSGLVVALLSYKVNPWAAWIGVLAILAFHRLERYQRQLRDGYSDRALALEQGLEKLMAPANSRVSESAIIASVARKLGRVPGIAHSSRKSAFRPAKPTIEDDLYSWQIIVLVVIFVLTSYIAEFTLALSAIGELSVLVFKHIVEILLCG